MTICVSKVYPGPIGGAIFSGTDAGGNRYRFIADYNRIFRAPVEGEVWTLEGSVKHHPKYGRQIHVEQSLLEKPSGRLIIDYLVRHPGFKGTGIGLKKAERLWDIFGEELYTILAEKDVTRLSLVLTDISASRLAEAWEKAAGEAEIIAFLSHYGFDVRLANKVRSIWFDNTIQKLQENPYRMLAFASWEKVDAVARALDVSACDGRRTVAAVESCLYRRLDAKHTVTPKEILADAISGVLKIERGAVVEEALRRAVEEYAVVPCLDGYQPLGAAAMEKVVADRFRSMISGGFKLQPSLFSTSIQTIIAGAVEKFRKDHGIGLTPEQRAAVEMALKEPLSIITGGAGVGKTTVLRIIHEVCEVIGTTVVQMALSGRAAQRMREATGRESSTIAKFLHAVDTGKIDPHSSPYVIIDESSMLDLPLMYSIVRALPEQSRLLLVGDPFQLPPIGFGLVFHILAKSHKVPRIEFAQVHRQALSSGIPQIAHYVRHGIVPELAGFTGIRRPSHSFSERLRERIVERLPRKN